MELFNLCLVIFFGRVLDMSLCTIRTIMTVRDKSLLAAFIGLFESFIWFTVVRQALESSVDGLEIALVYGLGFAAGTFLGGIITRKFLVFDLYIQIVTSNRNEELIHALRDEGFAVSVVNVNSSEFGGEKYMIFSKIKSKNFDVFKSLVNSFDEHAFIMVQDTKYVFNGYNGK